MNYNMLYIKSKFEFVIQNNKLKKENLNMKNDIQQCASKHPVSVDPHSNSFNFRYRRHWHSGRRMVPVMLTLAACSSVALAIGPSDQLVSSDLYNHTTVSSVVDFLGTQNAAGDYGTGSIIATTLSGQTAYAYILTADHVACDNTQGTATAYSDWVAIGSNNGTAAGVANTFQETLIAAGGPDPTTAFEDLAIVKITLGNISNPQTASLYNSIVPFTIVNPSTWAIKTGTAFTEYGYGNTSTAYTSPGGTAGYRPANSDFTLRFQNNKVNSIVTTGPADYVAGASTGSGSKNTGANYRDAQITWKTVAPANPAFQGTSFPGDSGGPYLAGGTFLEDITRGGAGVTNSVYSDYLFGVHTYGVATGGNGIKLNGDINGGVYIDQSNYNWIMTSVPEPTTIAIAGLGGVAFLAVIRRRQS